MVVYVLYYLLIIILSLPIKGLNKKKFIIISCACLTALVALRHPSMGIDLGTVSTSGYLNSYKIIGNMSWASIINRKVFLNYEFGYIVLNKTLYLFSSDVECLLIVCAILSIVPFFILLYYESKDSLLSILIYMSLSIFLISFSGLRQAIAMGICCIAYIFLSRRKLFPFILCVLLASLFHSSSIIFLLAYPAFKLKIRKNNLLIYIFSFFAIFLLRNVLFTVLCKFFGYEFVIDNNGAWLFSIFLICIFCFIVFLNETDGNNWESIVYISCIIQLFSGLNNIVMRIGYYYLIGLTLSLPNVISEIKNKKNRQLIKACFVLFFIVYGYYAISHSSWAEASPYSFFWSN